MNAKGGSGGMARARESPLAEASGFLSQAELSEFNNLYQSTYSPISSAI